MQRRKFIESFPIISFLSYDIVQRIADINPEDWSEVKSLFPTPAKFINLNSGSAGTMPLVTQKSLTESIKHFNSLPTYKAWAYEKETMQWIHEKLGALIGVDGHRIAINRNATEGLQTIIANFKFTDRKQIIFAEHEYPFAYKKTQQIADLKGLDKLILDIDLQTMSDEEIIQSYKKHLTADTGLLILTHMTHREGRILPIKEIVDIAKELGVKVLLDGAQSYGHIDFNVADLGVDYFITSLHKWLNAPLGTGLIYVKEGSESFLDFPSASETKEVSHLEHFGTSAYYLFASIESSLRFLDKIPIIKKQERLKELNAYWVEQYGADISIANPNREQIYGLTTVSISNLHNGKIYKRLYQDHGINAKLVGIKNHKSKLRVSPNIFTLESELDQFVDVLHQLKKDY